MNYNLVAPPLLGLWVPQSLTIICTLDLDAYKLIPWASCQVLAWGLVYCFQQCQLQSSLKYCQWALTEDRSRTFLIAAYYWPPVFPRQRRRWKAFHMLFHIQSFMQPNVSRLHMSSYMYTPDFAGFLSCSLRFRLLAAEVSRQHGGGSEQYRSNRINLPKANVTHLFLGHPYANTNVSRGQYMGGLG